ncbi:predicted signal transduction protein containing a membrane domain, an EAL and a GGDEF domain [Hahella chejuensis KCTC 2396]|uniref:cyclic-guanylate-specific phosphodiesterase n=2 Tax=Hahella chejuensis TaxID=158327 RepID=Q2SPM3_HAHCH|nr:predicted signal transduction protein containing a membrane domain, an EAL and a GGDEF domain [Hahella chejuensis KCTC 2396]
MSRDAPDAVSDMTLKFHRRISFKLARAGVILAFILGGLLSSIQVYFDYLSHEKDFRDFIERVLQAARPPAVRAVHTLDARLAEEVVTGLMQYDYVHQVLIVDELGQILAEGAKPVANSSTGWITSSIGAIYRNYPIALQMESYHQLQTGRMEVVVNVDKALEPFFNRAYYVLIIGIVRNMVLVLLLFIAFYYMITRPLISLAASFSEVNPEDPGDRRLRLPRSHDGDELGYLAQIGNQFLETLQKRLEERRQAEETLRDSERQTRQIIDTVPHLIYAKDRNGAFVFVNQALASFYDRNITEIEGGDHHSLHHLISNLESVRFDNEDREVIDKQKVMFIPEHGLTDIYGRRRILQSNKIPFRFFGKPCALIVSVDITDRVEAQSRVEQLAFHDPLTGLPNRNLFYDRLTMDIARSRNHGAYGALLLIDLDNFKNINDSLGHSVGDELLRNVAKNLRNCLDEEITVGRLGGDEFTVIMPELGRTPEEAEQNANLIAAKVLSELSTPFFFNTQEFTVTASMGVALYPDKDANTEVILRYADTALFQAKHEGRNKVTIFKAEMADAVSKRLSIENELRTAVKDKALMFYYQPQVSVTDGRIIGAEALIRWNHPQRGLITPDEFVPVLENSNLILTAGLDMFTQACMQVKEWLDKGWWEEDMRVAVNVSPKQFYQPEFVEQIIEILEATRLPAYCIELEVTESVVIQNVKDTINKMLSLKGLGVRFSLDDFGTGYSSLSYLKRLPVDSLKIDRSFVTDINSDVNDAAIVSTILAMAAHLDLEVVAEGVETVEHLEFLKENECDYYQGYLFSKPLPAEEMGELLRLQPKNPK